MLHSPGGDTSDHTLQETGCGTKRLFRNGASRLQPQKHQIEDLPDHEEPAPITTGCKLQCNPLRYNHVNQNHESTDSSDSHLEKRLRNNDWPLKSNLASNSALPEYQPALQAQCKMYQRSSSQPRSSRFVEATVNDRASHKSYTGNFDASVPQCSGKEMTSSHDSEKPCSHGIAHPAKNSPASLAVGDELELRRLSSVFCFGRSLAAAFNPSSWKVWARAQERINRERTHGICSGKIEDHCELNGVRTIPSSTSKSHTVILARHASYGKHDSGVEFADHPVLEDQGKVGPSKTVESSSEGKRQDRVFQTVSQWGYDHCRAPEKDPKSADFAFHNQKSSLPNIRMVYNHHKPSDHPENLLRQPNALRRLPSRKDLQRQQKLVKRVSDLEGRLEAARWQLAETLGKPIPEQASECIRLRSTPSMLASLPSSPLLGAHEVKGSDSGAVDVSSGTGQVISPNQREEKRVKDSQAEGLEAWEIVPHARITHKSIPLKTEVSVVNSVLQPRKLWPTENPKLARAAFNFQRGTPSVLENPTQNPRKRKGDGFSAVDDGVHRLSTESEDDGGSEASKIPPPQRKPGHPQKLQNNDFEVQLLPNSASVGQVTDKNMHLNRGRISHTRKEQHGLNPKIAYSSPAHSHNPLKGYQSPMDEEYRIGLSAILIGEVPPVPRLPMSMSSASPDIATKLSTKGKAKPYEEDTVYTDSAQVFQEDGCGRGKDKEPFEWPEDVF